MLVACFSNELEGGYSCRQNFEERRNTWSTSMLPIRFPKDREEGDLLYFSSLLDPAPVHPNFGTIAGFRRRRTSLASLDSEHQNNGKQFPDNPSSSCPVLAVLPISSVNFPLPRKREDVEGFEVPCLPALRGRRRRTVPDGSWNGASPYVPSPIPPASFSGVIRPPPVPITKVSLAPGPALHLPGSLLGSECPPGSTAL